MGLDQVCCNDFSVNHPPIEGGSKSVAIRGGVKNYLRSALFPAENFNNLCRAVAPRKISIFDLGILRI